MLLLLLTSVKTVNVLPDERAEPGHKTPAYAPLLLWWAIHERVTVWHISITVEDECDEPVESVKKTTASICSREIVSDFMGCLCGSEKKNFTELDEWLKCLANVSVQHTASSTHLEDSNRLLIHCVYFTSSRAVSINIPCWKFLSFFI